MIKNITTLALAITLAAGSMSANTKVEQLFKQPTPEQKQRFTGLCSAVGNLIHNAALFPAHKVKLNKAEAIEAKEFLTAALDFLNYFEKIEGTGVAIEEVKTWALNRLYPLIERLDETFKLVKREHTVVKLLAACLDSLNDPIYRRALVRDIKALHKSLLAIGESDLQIFAEAVGVKPEVAAKTIEQLKAIEPQVERLTKLACDVGHNQGANGYNELIKQENMRGAKRRNAIKYSSKLMEGYAIAMRFFDHAIRPWGGADVDKLVADFEQFKAEPSPEDKEKTLRFMHKIRTYFISVCKELIGICDKAIAK